MEEREAPVPRRPRRPGHDPNAFRVGNVINRSFQIWARTVVSLLLLSFLAMAPMLAWTGYKVAVGAVHQSPFVKKRHGPRDGADWDAMTVNVATSVGEGLAAQVCSALATALVVFTVLRRLRDERPSFAESLRGGLRRVHAVFALSLLVLLCYLGPPASLLGFLAVAGLRDDALLVAGVLVMLAWLVPLLWMVVAWWVAVPAVVIERPGIAGALRRSQTLTRGHRWHVLLLLLLLTGIGWAAGMAGGILVITAPAAGLVVVQLTNVVATSLGATFAAVTYHDLRREKEGTPADQMAQVFA